MRVEVNGARIFFDVEGAKLVPDGPVMREKPTLLLLHGGPGGDHSSFKPAFSQYADVAQVVYIDHRGNGRSERAGSETENLAQWGDDIHAFCEALEIEKPIVMGQSFGGFVAISYATRHPEHPGKLILSSTLAKGRAHSDRSVEMYEKFGGPEIGELAKDVLLTGLTRENLPLWIEKAVPLYNRRANPDPDSAKRTVFSARMVLAFGQPGAEGRTFDMLGDLKNIQCPTLVLGGEEDPQTPIEGQADIAAGIRQHLVEFHRIPNAGHGAYRDDPAVFDIIRRFILA